MPLAIDALKKLLGASGDLNAENPNGMVAQESQAGDNIDELKQHLGLQAEFPHSYFASAKAPYAIAKQTSDLANGPNFGVAATKSKDDFAAANAAALQAGFRGDQNIAGPASGGGDALGSHLYANLGDRSGDTPAQMASHSATGAAMYKEDAPTRAAVAKALAEAQGHILEDQNTYNLRNHGPNPTPLGGPPPAGPAPGGPPAAPVKPKGAYDQLKEFITSSGPTPYNGLSDLLSAKTGRALSGVAATPESSAIQENLLGNAQSLAGIFPSSRAAGVLSKIAQDFQSNYGNETPASSHLRLKNQIAALDNAETEFDNPEYQWKTGANGRLQQASTNQTIQRAKLAVATSRATLQRALQQMEMLHPGIGAVPGAPGPQGPGPQAPQPAAPSRYERIPGGQ